jgi:hypothetical protein
MHAPPVGVINVVASEQVGAGGVVHVMPSQGSGVLGVHAASASPKSEHRRRVRMDISQGRGQLRAPRKLVLVA